MSTPREKQDWLEPPDWWKKWRPLRWLVAALLLLAVWMVVKPLLPESAPAPEVVRATAVPQRADVEPVAMPVPTATPTATATAVPTATAAATTPASAAVVEPAAEPVPEQEAQVYFEEALGDTSSESEIAAFSRIESDPVRLLGPYRSYIGVDEVVVGLDRAGFAPVVESRHPSVRDGIPPRDLDTVTVTQYRHWNVPGRLQLQFFNDRLYQTEFEPDDATRYKAAQQRELPQLKRETSGRSELISGHLRIASSLDLAISDVGRKLDTRPFLIWQDRRLVRQRDEWDRRFALEAVP